MALQEEFEKTGNWLFKYRSYIPLLVLGVGIIVFIVHKMHAESGSYICNVIFEFSCLLVSLLGLVIRIFTVGYTPRGTSGRNTEGQLAEELNTTGIYSIVRHSLYLGNFFMWLGPAILTQNVWFIVSFCLFYWLYYERIMFAEEQFLRKKFGEAYTTWSEKTPPFIPKFKQYKKPNLSFSWKKVLRKEKDGFLSTCIIFSILSALGTWLSGSEQYNYYMFGFLGVSVIIYSVLQFLKKRTHKLDDDR